MQLQLTNRIILLSPFAAKRLAMLLPAVMQQYEAHYSPINLTAARSEPPQPAQELSAMGAAKPHAVQ